MALTLIKTATVGAGGASSLDFTNVPQTFTDLLIVASIRNGTGAGAQGGRAFKVIFNGSNSNRTTRWLNGNGSSASSSTDDYFWATGSDSTANVFGNTNIYIPNYTSSTNKAYGIDSVGENNSSLAEMNIGAHLWANTAAITSISIMPTLVGNLAEGTTATLYGVTKAAALTAKATGGTISYSADGYVYHAFTSSGTFTPTTSLTADILVVAGGGAGSQDRGGGGGAGGLVAFTAQNLTATGYTVTVGAGGAGRTVGYGLDGSNSQFASLTAAVGGGGGGAGDINANGRAGGSGGGGGNNPSVPNAAGGAGTSGQGYAGGTGTYTAPNYGAGGGGGAGGVGGNGWNTGSGSGGIGSGAYSTWAYATGTGSAGYYAGGGGAGSYLGGTNGAGGTGGGGAGVRNGTSNPGVANSGGGGGSNGEGGAYAGGSGGSGVVIVRYKG